MKISVVRILGWCTGLAAILLALLLAWRIGFGSDLPSGICETLGELQIPMKIATWKDLKQLQANAKEYSDVSLDIKRLTLKVDATTAAVAAHLDPGPRPGIWYFSEWAAWPLKRKAYVEAEEASRKARRELFIKQKRAQELLAWSQGTFTDPQKLNDIINRIIPVRSLWNKIIVPILEIGLVIAFFRFGIRLILRAMLIGGWIRPVKL